MKIRWHKRAAAALHQVEDYLLREFGESVRQEFMQEVEQAYRSIIVRRLNKVVYYVKDDTIHVAAFWDTRREPKRQSRQTR